MKTREEIKLSAKQAFYEKYWMSVGVLAVYILIVSAASYTGVGALILAGPMVIGLNSFFLKRYRGMEASFDTMFTDGFTNFGRNLGGYLWMELFLMLWSLLFVIPGIIKAYSYAMTPFILADCPNVKAKDALKLSMRMMNGHKWEYFVFQLSFIGWNLLSALTCGLLAIFYAGPYQVGSFAGYYSELKLHSLEQGVIDPAELA